MGIYNTLKEVFSLVQKADNIELNNKLLQLQNDLFELINENQDLKTIKKDLENKINLSKSLSFKENVYWCEEDGPFCSKCWDADNKLIRIHSDDGAIGRCPNCKTKAIFNKQLYDSLYNEPEDDVYY